ncbi:MAG: hypothetical protein AAFO81_14015 [Pseudomonadota bacterium]
MRPTIACFAFTVVCFCATSNGAAQSTNTSLSDEEKAYISLVETDGRLLYEKDIRAANASDLLLQEIDPSDYPNFVGWVTRAAIDGYTVSFYERTERGFDVVADVKYSERAAPVLTIEPDRKPSEIEISMIRA